MILNYYKTPRRTSSEYVDIELTDLFATVYHQVHHPLYDPKGYQRDIKHLTWDERNSIQARAKLDYERANEARKLETVGKKKESIEKWGEILGPNFPAHIS